MDSFMEPFKQALHDSRERWKKSPIVHMSPEVKKSLTPNKLKAMNFCGMFYLVTVVISIFWSAFFITMPVVYVDDPETLFNRRLIACFLLFNVVVNLYYLVVKDCYYTTADSNDVLPDISWKKCLDCDLDAPPRSHHCPLCRRCILKRDHHCFFTGSCVGFRNQRYFVVFSTYSTISAGYSAYLIYMYLGQVYHNDTYRFYDYFLPVALIQWIFGYQSLGFLGSLMLQYLNATTFMASGSQLAMQIFLIAQGITTYEWTSGKYTYRTMHILKNYRDVLGSYWILHFILPMPWRKIAGDGISWEAKVV